jgi:hypothetical protein
MKIFCDADTSGAPFLRRSQDVLREKEGLRGIGLGSIIMVDLTPTMLRRA